MCTSPRSHAKPVGRRTGPERRRKSGRLLPAGRGQPQGTLRLWQVEPPSGGDSRRTAGGADLSLGAASVAGLQPQPHISPVGDLVSDQQQQRTQPIARTGGVVAWKTTSAVMRRMDAPGRIGDGGGSPFRCQAELWGACRRPLLPRTKRKGRPKPPKCTAGKREHIASLAHQPECSADPRQGQGGSIHLVVLRPVTGAVANRSAWM
jgi:hypothetical protein